MCVGILLVIQMIHLVLASFIHSFDWEPPKGMSAEQVDMTEKFEITMSMVVPLEVILVPCLPLDVY
jgi:hypothetical protein